MPRLVLAAAVLALMIWTIPPAQAAAANATACAVIGTACAEAQLASATPSCNPGRTCVISFTLNLVMHGLPSCGSAGALGTTINNVCPSEVGAGPQSVSKSVAQTESGFFDQTDVTACDHLPTQLDVCEKATVTTYVPGYGTTEAICGQDPSCGLLSCSSVDDCKQMVLDTIACLESRADNACPAAGP